jgi:hypothetical protein
MNNEPYAWINVNDEYKILFDDELPNYYPEAWMPLYTHPAKTLTEDTECQYCKQGCIRCDARKLLTDDEIKELSEKHLDMDWQTGVIKFARAILRKAQEK